jgi:hypothetical protein
MSYFCGYGEVMLMAVLCPSMTYTCRDGLRRTPNPRFPILRSICSLRSGRELQKSWALQECEGRSPTCRIEKNLSASSLKKVPRMSHEPSMISTLREFPTHSLLSISEQVPPLSPHPNLHSLFIHCYHVPSSENRLHVYRLKLDIPPSSCLLSTYLH